MPLSEEYLKSVSESQLKDRAYTPFELEQYDRDSLEEIKRCLKLRKYKDKDSVKEMLDFVENLANKINVAASNEKKENKTTWELESDLVDIHKIFDQLNALLQQFEQSESENSTKPKKRPRK